MSEHRPDVDREGDPELDAFVAEAIGTLDRDMGSRAVARSFGDVLARAHRLDPQRVPASVLAEDRRSRRVVELRPHRESAEVAVRERALDELITDARIELETEIAQARPMSSTLRPPAPQHHRGMRWGALAGGLAVAAALVLAALNVTTSTQRTTDDEKHQAFAFPNDGRGTEQSLELRPAPRAASEEPARAAPEVEPEPVVEEQPAVAAPRERPRPAAAPTRQERMRALDERAQKLWRAGSVDAAERTFEELIALAGEDRLAELAYADLFSIAHRRGDDRRQVELWHEYLERFPTGRYADDARAGLCRQSRGDAELACWAAYLHEMPRGSYRAEATRIVGARHDADQ